MKTTYVLGSGFSASVGLPVVANLFSEIFSLRGSYEYDDADFSRVLEAMNSEPQDQQDSTPTNAPSSAL